MNSGYSTFPFTPIQGLPKLACLANITTSDIKSALDNLKTLYFPTITDELSRQASKVLCRSPKPIPGSVFRLDGQATPVPDSGYASAEEEEDEEHEHSQHGDILRSDPFERAYALKWLTGFVGRSDIWLSSVSSDDEESERAELVEEGAKLISAFLQDASSSSSAEDSSTGEDKMDGSILRSFSFLTPAPVGTQLEKSEITVQLNDAPLSSSDHTSVGLQSWGSSIIFAERLCSDPAAFSVLPKKLESTKQPLRILELGAGTGLLSTTISKIAQLHSTAMMTIAATDFHPDVLTNLTSNVATNTRTVVAPLHSPPMISVYEFDWEHPDYLSPPFNELFDVTLAADVVYHPLHAAWIKSCVERLLLKPGANEQGGVFWLIIPIRTTGRHEGMHCTVENMFPIVLREERQSWEYIGEEYELAILELEIVAKREGIGRADESGYRLYKIGWVPRVLV